MNALSSIVCSRCGATAWIDPAQGGGTCPNCRAPVALHAAGAPVCNAAGAAQPYAAAPANPYATVPANPYAGVPGFSASMPRRGGAPVGRVLAGALVALVGAGGALAKRYARSAARGGASELSEFNINTRAADVDQMFAAAQALAVRWKPDAQFRAINVFGLRPDGTVDLSNSDSHVEIAFFSPSAVSSYVASARQDAIRKFVFNSSGIHYDTRWGVRERVDHPAATPMPTCGVRQLAALLSTQGTFAATGGTVRVSYDPRFAFAAGDLSYHVTSGPSALSAWYDVAGCALLRQ